MKTKIEITVVLSVEIEDDLTPEQNYHMDDITTRFNGPIQFFDVDDVQLPFVVTGHETVLVDESPTSSNNRHE
jgi:hypothetical protein